MSNFAETSRSGAHRLEISGVIGGTDSDNVYRAFVDPDLLTAWWADEADVEPTVGGRLVVRWPAMAWTMRGTFLELESGRSIGFTWAWDHQPETPDRTVRVVLAAEAGGTRVTISHGDYGPEDEDERTGHVEGWLFFLPRIAAAVRGET